MKRTDIKEVKEFEDLIKQKGFKRSKDVQNLTKGYYIKGKNGIMLQMEGHDVIGIDTSYIFSPHLIYFVCKNYEQWQMSKDDFYERFNWLKN